MTTILVISGSTRFGSTNTAVFRTAAESALPGSFKNLLDWTVGGGTYRKPIARAQILAAVRALTAHARAAQH